MIVVLTQPAAVAPNASVLVVDASTAPFATAWNQALTAHRRARAWHHAARLASAVHARRAQRRWRRSSLGPGRRLRPVRAARRRCRAAPARPRRLVRWRGWPVWTGVALSLFGLARVRRARARAVDHHARDPHRRHLAGARPPARQRAGTLLRNAPAPAPATDGAILLAVLAVWTMAAIADWLAFGRQAALGALARRSCSSSGRRPSAPGDWRSCSPSRSARASRRFLLAQNLAVLDRRRSWLVSQHATRPHWLAPAACSAPPPWCSPWSSRPCSPAPAPIRSSTSPTPAATTRRRRSYRPSLAPFIDVGDKLDDVEDQELFTVRRIPARLLAHRRARRVLGRQRRAVDAQRRGRRQGAGRAPRRRPGRHPVQQFSIGPLGERWLPAAFRPVPSTSTTRWWWSRPTRLSPTQSDVSGLDYVVARSCRRRPAPSSPPRRRGDGGAVPRRPRAVHRAPARPPRSPQIARSRDRSSATAGATTPYAQAKALRDYFRDGRLRLRHRRRQPRQRDRRILEFLRAKRGFCVQFASAYAVMARTLGIPARVAVGFTPGTPTPTAATTVDQHDAHAWPEVWLAGIGWTHLFDPTPAAVGDGHPAAATCRTTPRPAPTAPRAAATTAADGHQRPDRPAAAPERRETPGSTPATPTLAPAVPTPTSDDGLGPWLVGDRGARRAGAGDRARTSPRVLVAKRRRRRPRRNADDPARRGGGRVGGGARPAPRGRPRPDPALTPIEFARARCRASSARRRREPLRELARTYSTARYGDGATGPTTRATRGTSLDELDRRARRRRLVDATLAAPASTSRTLRCRR